MGDSPALGGRGATATDTRGEGAFAEGACAESASADGDCATETTGGAGSTEGATTVVVTTTVFGGVDNNSILSFCPCDPSFTGGLSVGYTRQTGRGGPGILVATGQGGSPQVCTFDPLSGRDVDQFFAYNPLFSAGVFVSGGTP